MGCRYSSSHARSVGTLFVVHKSSMSGWFRSDVTEDIAQLKKSMADLKAEIEPLKETIATKDELISKLMREHFVATSCLWHLINTINASLPKEEEVPDP